MSRNSRPDIDEIEARTEKATEGPWVRWSTEGQSKSGRYLTSVCYHEGDYMSAKHECVAETMHKTEEGSEQDAQFIAHARTDIPALCAYVRELEEIVRDQIFARLRKYYTYADTYRWLEAGHPQLNGERPLDLINSGRSEEVLAILDRLDSGAYL